MVTTGKLKNHGYYLSGLVQSKVLVVLTARVASLYIQRSIILFQELFGSVVMAGKGRQNGR